MLRNCWLKWFENRMHYRRLVGRSMSRMGRTAAQNRPVPVRVGEVFEDRTLLTTFIVDTTVDESNGTGDLSLREAIEQSEATAGADIIRFAPGLEGALFNITLGPLPTITDNLQILGTIGNAQTINGAGLTVEASGAGDTTTFLMNGVNINLDPTGPGLLVQATDDGVANATVFNSRITNNATQGVKFVAHTGGVANLTLAVVSILSNGDVTPSEGIRGEVGVDAAGAESLTLPGNFATANLNLSTLRVGSHALEGFNLLVEDGGQVTTTAPIRESVFSGNGVGNTRSGLKFTATDAGSNLAASFSNVTINNSTGHGFEFHALAGANLDTHIVNSRALKAKADALHYQYNASTGVNTLDGFSGNDAGDNGAEILLFNGSLVRFDQFDNATFNRANNSGVQIGVLNLSMLDAFNSTGLTASGSFNGSGVLLTTINGTSNFVFTDLTTNNNLIRGVQVGENMGGTSTKTFNNFNASGNILAQPILLGVSNGAVLNLAINGGTLNSAAAPGGANSIFSTIRGGGTANYSLDGLNLNGSSSSGIVLDYDQASLGTVNVSNTTSIGNRAVGAAVFVKGGSDVDANFTNLDVSGAGQAFTANGVRLDVVGATSIGDFTFNNVTANNASGHGISLFYNAGATGTVNAFNNVTALSAGRDGLNVQVRGVASQLTAFNANGVNVSGAGGGATQTGDGLDLSVIGPGSMGTFSFQNLTADTAGGRGVKVQGENTATLQLNVDGFSIDSNGLEGVVIDVGTIVAGTQLLASTFANGTASSNGLAFMVNAAGLRASVGTAGSSIALNFDGVSTNSNTDDGISLNATGGAVLSADLRNGVASLGNAQHGVDFFADGAATTASLLSSVPGNNYDGNGGNGVNVLLTGGVTANEVTIQGSASTNQGDGVLVRADDASGVTINTLQVTGNNPTLNNNFGNGLVIALDTVSGISALDLSALTVNDNVLDQINVSLTNMTLQDISLANINADGPGVGMGNGDGIELTLDNTDITNSLDMSNIVAVNNGQDGLELRIFNGATIPVGSVIDQGTFDDNGQHGINLNVNNSTVTLNLTNADFAMGSISSASGNGGNGLNVRLNMAVLTMETIDHQTFDRNAGAGVDIQAATPSTFTSNNSFTNNQITDNGSFGLRGIFNGTTANPGFFDISIGSTTTPGSGNVFDNNVGAAINIDMVQNSIGKLQIVDNEITRTNAGPGSFTGVGIQVRQIGTVDPIQATNLLRPNAGDPGGTPGVLIQNNLIGVDDTGMAAGNASHGILFQSEEQSQINGLDVLDNMISNNGLDGLNFVRLDQVDINNFEVLRNEFTGNQDDGLEILGQNDTNDILFVTIDDNDISSNADNGLSFQVNADARIDVDIDSNMIIQNGTDGIQTREVILDISDERAIIGTWSQNVIADNTRNGVRIGAVTSTGFFSQLNVVNNKVGATFDVFGQVILDGNGSTGIEINGAGRSTWTDNEIIRNGRSVTGNRAVGHGVDVQGAGFKSTTLRRNLIRENFQDGVEFVNSTTLPFTLTLDDNRIQQNAGRGLDILNQESLGSTTVSISSGSNNRTNNQFSSNGEEGIYVVNTSSTTQNQTDFSGTDLAQDGAVNRRPDLQLFLEDATISNNGSAANTPMMVASAGLMIRVGTSDHSTAYRSATPGSFSTDFATNGTSSTLINGGVYAELLDSSLHGNFGDDVFIHGYTSTNDPAATAGTWSDMEFNTTAGQGDPLARFDLVWGIQSFDYDSVDVLNSVRRGTPGGEAGAFYNNAEGTFKSRTANSTPGGPHANGPGPTRRRNAQRVPARTLGDGTVLRPFASPPLNPNSVPADFGRFQYPGWGDSTFRVRSANGASVAPFSGGVSFTPNTTSGEIFFTWGGFAPQKLNFGPDFGDINITEGDPPVVIDSGIPADLLDAELDGRNGGLGNYDNASITIRRDGFGFNPTDLFGFQDGNGLTLVGGNTIQKAGSTIATFVNDGFGMLTVTFTDGKRTDPDVTGRGQSLASDHVSEHEHGPAGGSDTHHGLQRRGLRPASGSRDFLRDRRQHHAGQHGTVHRGLGSGGRLHGRRGRRVHR